eukprot:9413490-Pyramimonas_sp.AAC.1
MAVGAEALRVRAGARAFQKSATRKSDLRCAAQRVTRGVQAWVRRPLLYRFALNHRSDPVGPTPT